MKKLLNTKQVKSSQHSICCRQGI